MRQVWLLLMMRASLHFKDICELLMEFLLKPSAEVCTETNESHCLPSDHQKAPADSGGTALVQSWRSHRSGQVCHHQFIVIELSGQNCPRFLITLC